MTLLFLALAAAFVVLFFVDRSTYERMLAEDHLVETGTAVALVVAAGLFVVLAGRRRRAGARWLFPAGLAALLVVGALEEISWGQRIFQVETPDLFERYSDQREINLHGVAQRLLAVRTKDVAALVLVLYGAVLPWLVRTGRLRPGAGGAHVIVPPLSLAVPWIIGALFMIDMPTGREEEIGELLFSLCLCAFARHELRAGA